MTAETRIGPQERSILLAIARSAVEKAAVRLADVGDIGTWGAGGADPADVGDIGTWGRGAADPSEDHIEAPPSFPEAILELGAAFVTLTLSGHLRGCIGTLKMDKPLWRAVRDAAWSAAREDGRFRPVDELDLKDISIEVSVLSPMAQIPSSDQFIPGEHGIVIEKNGRRGVFLPKVAAEMGWGREETLSALCKKAGLPVNAWQLPDAKFWLFTAEGFGERSSSR